MKTRLLSSITRERFARWSTLARVVGLIATLVSPASAVSPSSACACPTSGTSACTISNLIPADASSTCDPTLLDTDGFLDENIIIDGNMFIRSIDLSDLRRLGGELVFRDSRFVTKLEAVELVETTGGVRIEGSIEADDFTQLIELPMLRVVGGSFAVVGQTHVSFTALDVSSLESVNGYFNVSGNTNLKALNVKSLHTVTGGELKIFDNHVALVVRANCGVEAEGLVNGVVTDSNARASSTFTHESVSYCSLCTFDHEYGWDEGLSRSVYGATLGSSTLRAFNSSYSCSSNLDADGFLNENLTLIVDGYNDLTYDLSALKHIAGDLGVSYSFDSSDSSAQLTASQCNSTSTPAVSSWLSNPRHVSVNIQNLELVDGVLKVRTLADESRTRRRVCMSDIPKPRTDHVFFSLEHSQLSQSFSALTIDKNVCAHSPSYGCGLCPYAYTDVQVMYLEIKAPCASKTDGLLESIVSDANERASSSVDSDFITYCSRCTCPTALQTCEFKDMVPYSSEDRCDSASGFDAYSSFTGGTFAENITIEGNENIQTLALGDAVAISGFLEVRSNPYLDKINLDNLARIGMHVNIANNADALLRVHAQCADASDVDFIRELVVTEVFRASSVMTYDSHTCYSRQCRCTTYEQSCRVPTTINSRYSYCSSQDCMSSIEASYLEPYASTDVCTHSIMDENTGVFNGTLVVDEASYQYKSINGYTNTRSLDRSSFARLSEISGDLILARSAFAMYANSYYQNMGNDDENPFVNLTAIGGNLEIYATLGGQNLNTDHYDFRSLESIGGGLYVSNTAAGSGMTKFKAPRLASVGSGGMKITQNEEISRVTLGALKTIEGDLNVIENVALQSLDVSALASVSGALVISMPGAAARVIAPCAAKSTGFIASVVSDLTERSVSTIDVATTLYCVETKCTCGSSDEWSCYPTDLVAYSSDYLCDDVYDESTGQITADVAIENLSNLNYLSFDSVKTISGGLRVTNNPQLNEIRLNSLESVGKAIYVTKNSDDSLYANSVTGYVSQCVSGAPISYAVDQPYRWQSTFEVTSLWYQKDDYMTEQCFVPPSPPSPPMPPTPPAPARAAIESTVALLGYNSSTFGEAQRSAFIAVVASYLDIDTDAMAITSVTDHVPSERRRLHQSSTSGVIVAFKIEVSDYSTATTVIGPMLDELMSIPSTGSAPPLLELLQADPNLSTVLGVTAYTPAIYLAPPPPPPPPPPLCGNGALDPGESCDEGFGSGLNGSDRAACDATCQFDALYACTDWTAATCTCSNPVGVFAVKEATETNGADDGGCAQTSCTLYPDRCLPNGAGCVEGSWRTACVACEIGYYRSGAFCKKCGDNTAASAAVVVFVTVIAGLVGYRAAQVLDNTSTALIKGIVSSMQYVSINVDVNIRWPDEMVAIGRWFSSVNLNIDIIAPECISGSFNWYYIFWVGAVIFPATIALILVIREIYLRRAYVQTVITIDGDDSGYFIRAKTLFTGRDVKCHHSPDGMLVIAELQRQYQKRVAVRKFAVLLLTVIYLPIVRLCLQSYDCIYHGDGYVLEHDVDLSCEAPIHRATQFMASLILLVVGMGVPVMVLLKVRSIRMHGDLDGARELTSWGALYDIYRRPSDEEEDEEQKISVQNTTTMDEPFKKNVEDDTSPAATIKRSESRAQKHPSTKLDRLGAFLAVHYLTVELAQKFIVVACTSPRAANAAAGLLVVVYASFAAFVYFTQPWRGITLSVLWFVIPNALNRVEVLSLISQSVLVIITWSMNGAAATAAAGLLTTIVVLLLLTRTALFVSERLSFMRESKVRMHDDDPETARRRRSDRMLALAMEGDEMRLRAFHSKNVKSRNQRKARYESTRDAIMVRAMAGQGNRAMLELARKMMGSAKQLDPTSPPSGTARTHVGAALKSLDNTLDNGDKDVSGAQDTSVSLELTRMLSAHQMTIRNLTKLAREYADAECVHELLHIANQINKLKSASHTLPNRLGEREADELMSTLSGKACLEALHRAIADGDADAFVAALITAGTTTTNFEMWCATESAKFVTTVNNGKSDDAEEDILRIAQSALAARSAATTLRVRGFIHAWNTLGVDFAKRAWNNAVVAVRAHNEEMAHATAKNDFDATENAFTAVHAEVETFVSWCKKSKSRVEDALIVITSSSTQPNVSKNSGVAEVAMIALGELERCGNIAEDSKTGIRRIAATAKSEQTATGTRRKRQLNANAL